MRKRICYTSSKTRKLIPYFLAKRMVNQIIYYSSYTLFSIWNMRKRIGRNEYREVCERERGLKNPSTAPSRPQRFGNSETNTSYAAHSKHRYSAKILVRILCSAASHTTQNGDRARKSSHPWKLRKSLRPGNLSSPLIKTVENI